MKRLKNNKGLTLIELIVAIAILAIIVLPLLTSFVQATKTNVKAKGKLHATELAQNIMEGMENVSLEELVYQFDYPSSGFDLFDLQSASVAEVKEVSGSYVAGTSYSAPAEGVTPVFSPNADHKYYFMITGMKVNGSAKKYNAFVELDARTNEVGSVYKDINETPIANMESIDTTFDAISANTDTKDIIISTIQLQYGYSLLPSDISRTITIDISKDASTKATKVVSKYKYYIKKYNLTFPETGSLYESDYISTIYDNSEHVDDQLKNVYLFYYPWYASNYSYPLSTDNIEINNPDNIDCTVHVIKQANVDVASLYGDEANYKCSVFVNEVKNKGANVKAHTSINTNLGTNMSISDPGIAGYKIDNQATYIYNKTNANQSKVVNDIVKINSMTKQDKNDRLFDVTVSVYSSDVGIGNLGTATPLVKFTGGMVD